MLEFIAVIDQYLQLTVVAMLGLFIGFVVLMEIKTEMEGTRIYPVLKILLGVPYMIADCLVNWLISPIMLDLPAHPLDLVTDRMQRYKSMYSGTPRRYLNRRARCRLAFSIWLCGHLNRYDADHC